MQQYGKADLVLWLLMKPYYQWEIIIIITCETKGINGLIILFEHDDIWW